MVHVLDSDCRHQWSVTVDVQDASQGGSLRMQMRIDTVVCSLCGAKLGHRSPEEPRADDILPLYPLGKISAATPPAVLPIDTPVAANPSIPRVGPGIPYRPNMVNAVNSNPFTSGKHNPNIAVKPSIFGSCQQ